MRISRTFVLPNFRSDWEHLYHKFWLSIAFLECRELIQSSLPKRSRWERRGGGCSFLALQTRMYFHSRKYVFTHGACVFPLDRKERQVSVLVCSLSFGISAFLPQCVSASLPISFGWFLVTVCLSACHSFSASLSLALFFFPHMSFGICLYVPFCSLFISVFLFFPLLPSFFPSPSFPCSFSIAHRPIHTISLKKNPTKVF